MGGLLWHGPGLGPDDTVDDLHRVLAYHRRSSAPGVKVFPAPGTADIMLGEDVEPLTATLPTHPKGKAAPQENYDAGSAPAPDVYAAKGKAAGDMFRGLMQNPWDPEGGAGALPYLVGQEAHSRSGDTLDAQKYGADNGYGNYAFGVYNNAAGLSLPNTLSLADWYGRLFSTYPGSVVMDKDYPGAPAQNIANVTRGYKEQRNGTLWHKAK